MADTPDKQTADATAKNKPTSDKKRKRKKKHVSKHVLKAKEEATEKTVTEKDAKEGTSTAKKRKVKKFDPIKDPAEASHYLQAWQTKQGWKFNKNTQSWLLRHMYEPEKVSKSTFTILLEYIQGLQGKDAKSRALEEATARAKRYREYEKNKDKKEQNQTPDEKVQEGAAETALTNACDDDDNNDNYGLGKWKNLDDHEKRKEYKRARRVLEVLTLEA